MIRFPPEFWLFLSGVNFITIFVGIMLQDVSLVLLALFNILFCSLSYTMTKALQKKNKDDKP